MTKKALQQITVKKWFRYGVIPCVLLFVWLVLTIWNIILFDQSLLVVSFNHSAKNFMSITHDKLTKGEKLAGEFIASENNLGIVSLRFKSFQRVPYKHEDSLLFRLKEKGSTTWYYQNTYRSGFTYDLPFLPFGFPVIADSKGKTYQFELSSLKGTQENGVALSTRNPILASKYQFTKGALLAEKQLLITFLYEKTINLLYTIDVTFSSFVFALLLVSYLLYCSPLYNSRLRSLPSGVLLLTLLINIFYLQIQSDLYFFIIPIIWLMISELYGYGSNYSFWIALCFLLVSPFFLFFNNLGSAQQAGSTTFLFLVVGIILSLKELKKEK